LGEALSETAPVRPGEEIEPKRLEAYLQGRVEGAEQGIEIEQFPGGHSNLTYLLRCEGREYVLRRPPIGPVAPKAHDMAREYRVLEKVHPAFPAAPKVYLLCEDVTVIGAPFFLMERRHGIVLRGRSPDIDAARVSRAFLDCLVELHNVEIEPNGLAQLGKPEGFLLRQVQGWAERWRRATTDDAPKIEANIAWLAENIPEPLAPTLVHNDFKLDNLMLTKDLGRVSAVLDWEMTTVGDPLADVGLSLCYWTFGAAGGPDLSVAGWYSRDEFVHNYAQRTGRDVSRIEWYEVLGVFKLAVILQQIYYRWKIGQTQDPRFGVLGEQIRRLCKEGFNNSPATLKPVQR
jgi:aminoglycoside phosphotransferase (APT) family kinase protein